MIEFETLSYKNLLSIGNVPVVLELNKQRTTLIIGKNGHGKSIFLDALCFVLFGEAFRKINKGLLVNSINNKHMLVEVTFKVDGTRYLIRRGMKPTIFEVYKNDELIPQPASVYEYQDLIEKHILKVNHKAFCQIVILGKAEFVPFMKLKPAPRREVVEEILDIEIFSRMLSILKTWMGNNAVALKEATSEIMMAEHHLKAHQEKVASLRRSSQETIDLKLEKKSEHLEKIAELEETRQVRQNQLEEFNNIIDAYQVDKLEEDNERYQLYQTQLNTKLKRLQKEIEFYEKNETCPTCYQVIEEQFQKSRVEDKRTKIDDIEKALIAVAKTLAKLAEQLAFIAGVSRDSVVTNVAINRLETEIAHLTQYNEDIEREISELNLRTESIANTEAVSFELNNNLRNRHHLKEELTINRNIFDTINSILSDSGIKSLIIRQYVPVINSLLSGFLNRMNFPYRFELDENFDEQVLTRFREGYTYYSFSEGQKFRIDIALLFTWREIARLRNSVSTNLLILDETFDGSLDEDGTEEFMTLLLNLTNNENIFIISHNIDALQDKVEKVINFKLEKNFTKVVYANE